MRIYTISKHTAELYERNFWRIDQDEAVYSGDVNDSDRGTGFCDCEEYRERYEKLEGDELERTFCSEIRGTRYCKYEGLY